MKQRDISLDAAKGLAIILMLFSHTMTSDNAVRIWIFSFHMPIFFVISGILLHRKLSAQKNTGIAVRPFLTKRMFQLGVPYYFWGGVLILFYSALAILSHSELRIGTRLFALFSMQGIDSLWFLPSFFAAELLAFILLRRRKTVLAGVIAAATVASIVLFSSCMPEFWLLRVLVKCLVGFVFVAIGYMLEAKKAVSQVPAWSVILLLLIGAISSHYNGFVGIGSLQFQNGALFFLSAMVTSFGILKLFSLIESRWPGKCGILTFFGKNSMVLLCTNNLLIETVRLLDYKLMGDIFLAMGLLGSVIMSMGLLAVEYFLIRLADTRLGILYGKRN